MHLSTLKLFKTNYQTNNSNIIFGLLSQNDDSDYNLDNHVECRYIFVLDTSNSMNIKADGDKSRKEQLIEAMSKLVSSPVLDGKKIEIYSFSDESEKRLESTEINTGSKEMINGIVKDLKKTLGRKTFLYKPLEDIYKNVQDAEDCYYHIILFTDGDDFESAKTLNIVKKLRDDKNITVSFVAFGDEYKMNVMTDLANAGRGSFYHLNDITNFYKEIRNDIKIAAKRVISKTTLNFSTSGNNFSLDSIFKVGESGIIKLDNSNDRFLLGGLSADEQIFFKINQKPIAGEGEYKAGAFIISTGGSTHSVLKEFDLDIQLSNEIVPEMPDPEISDILRRIRMYDISLEVENLTKAGKHKEAEAKLKSAMPIAQQLGIDEDVTIILRDKNKAGHLNIQKTRKLVSDSKTKGLRRRKRN